MKKSLTLYIKNMVCPRCISSVREILQKNNAEFKNVTLGMVTLEKPLTPSQYENVESQLNAQGLEFLSEKTARIAQRIKTLLIDVIHYDKPAHRLKLSAYLSKELKADYSYLSKLFSQSEGITIEQFLQKQKIERVKELLSYDELSVSEIAHQLEYSSPAHLSTQFKKITGLSPMAYKQLDLKPRNALDEI